MSILLSEWAAKWNLPYAAILELREMLGQQMTNRYGTMSEAGVQARVRLAAAKMGWRLWRNNVGALLDSRGIPVRYGLCNDSAELNDEFKSHDLVGIKPMLIGPQHVGHVIGQFTSREVKKADWQPGEDLEREAAQERFALLVNSLGGDAKFTTGDL